jgi:hypothetical protein
VACEEVLGLGVSQSRGCCGSDFGFWRTPYCNLDLDQDTLTVGYDGYSDLYEHFGLPVSPESIF